MTWLYPVSPTEYVFIGSFLLLYGLYIARTFRLARQLNTSAWGVVPKFFLRSSYLTLLLIALLGPSFGETEGDVVTLGRDVYVLIDGSRSMDAADVVPTRLEQVKFAVQKLCDTLPADRFGLIVAAPEPFVLSPLTADHDALKRFVQELRTDVSPSGGTDLCAALVLGRQKLLTDPTTRQSAKALVLFSDGETTGPCDRTELARLRQFGIPLVTVGIGTDRGASIREGRGFIRDETGQIVRSRLNRQFLQVLARDGRGQYVEADAGERYVDKLADVLRSLPGRTIDRNRVAVSTNKYYYFLWIALALLAFDLLITVRTFRL